MKKIIELCPECTGDCKANCICPWQTWEYGPSSLSEGFYPTEAEMAEDTSLKPAKANKTYVVVSDSSSVETDCINDAIELANSTMGHVTIMFNNNVLVRT